MFLCNPQIRNKSHSLHILYKLANVTVQRKIFSIEKSGKHSSFIQENTCTCFAPNLGIKQKPFPQDPLSDMLDTEL